MKNPQSRDNYIVMKPFVLSIILFISLSFTSCFFWMHGEPYETIPIEGLNFCAFRHDSEYFHLHYYDESRAQELVVWDVLQSVLYGDNVIVARCALNRDFFVRYYFVTYDSLNSQNYHVSEPISEQACLDSLKAHNLDPAKMNIVVFENFDRKKIIRTPKQ